MRNERHRTKANKKHNLPSQTSQLPRRSARPRNRHASQQLSEILSTAHQRTSEADAKGAKECDVAFPEEVLEVACIGAYGGDGKDVGGGQPG